MLPPRKLYRLWCMYSLKRVRKQVLHRKNLSHLLQCGYNRMLFNSLVSVFCFQSKPVTQTEMNENYSWQLEGCLGPHWGSTVRLEFVLLSCLSWCSVLAESRRGCGYGFCVWQIEKTRAACTPVSLKSCSLINAFRAQTCLPGGCEGPLQ